MVVTHKAKKQPEIDVLLRRELSDYLAKKFMCHKMCFTCNGTGVRVWMRTSEGELQYSPCHCLRLIRKKSNETKIVPTTEK